MKKRKTPEAVTEVKSKRVFVSLSCPRFGHWKDTEACTVLRAKRACKYQCLGYFKWAQTQEEAVVNTISKHDKTIRAYLKFIGKPHDQDLLKNVMPQGDHLCELCGRSFKHAGKLKWHQKNKHKRQLSTQMKGGSMNRLDPTSLSSTKTEFKSVPSVTKTMQG